MNSDIYIFGKLGTYYSQYPNDFASEIFMKMGEWYTPADTYISVHRKGELMYYGYVRKLKTDCYIGLCSVLNGMMVTDLNALFEVFDSMLNHLAVGGEILKYSDSGEIVANVQSLVYGKPALNQVRALLKGGLSGLSANLKGLPPESYGISVNESKQFDLHTDDMSQIVSASWSYSYTFIAKDSGTPTADSYQGVLQRLHKERKELEITNSDLSNQILKLKKEQKQQSVVFAVSAVAIICFFVLLGVMQSLDVAQGDLALSQKELRYTQKELDQTKKDFVDMKKKWKEKQSDFLDKMYEKDREIISLQNTNKQMDTEIGILKNEIYNQQYNKNKLIQLENENYTLRRDLNQYKKELQRAYIGQKDGEVQISRNTDQSRSTRLSTGNAIVTLNAPLRTESRVTAPEKINIPKGSSIEVIYSEHRNGYYKVRYRNIVGYVSDVFIKFN